MDITLPIIRGWPYAAITAGLKEFEDFHHRHPARLLVGRGLWSLLREADCTAKKFYTDGGFRIFLDLTGVLELHEFMYV